ncbi:hypothetical protein AMECASPLE_009513 [Ameca splendens]|uniref:Uncharacterized protein n=1 Tax=Ameca splendens TaxID=208324 RepID=A0ABV0Y0N5_9TELE
MQTNETDDFYMEDSSSPGQKVSRGGFKLCKASTSVMFFFFIGLETIRCLIIKRDASKIHLQLKLHPKTDMKTENILSKVFLESNTFKKTKHLTRESYFDTGHSCVNWLSYLLVLQVVTLISQKQCDIFKIQERIVLPVYSIVCFIYLLYNTALLEDCFIMLFTTLSFNVPKAQYFHIFCHILTKRQLLAFQYILTCFVFYFKFHFNFYYLTVLQCLIR